VLGIFCVTTVTNQLLVSPNCVRLVNPEVSSGAADSVDCCHLPLMHRQSRCIHNHPQFRVLLRAKVVGVCG
jgi:hypothetical protein